MRTTKLQVFCLWAGVVCGASRPAAAPGEWRFPRGDLANTGRQPLPAQITHPQIRGRFYVGGRIDGLLPGGVSLQGGDLVALDPQLHERWRVSFHDFYEILGQFDFDGDGREEILAMGSEALSIVSLEGAVLWEQRFEGTLHSARIKVASLVPGLRGLQLVVWPDRVAFGTALRFDEGFAKAATLWRSVEVPETGAGYPPELVVADMNLDGVRDLALATFGKILVLDGATGQKLEGAGGQVEWISGGVNGRNYGTLWAMNLDDDPYPELVLVADAVCLHVAVIDNGAAGLALAWDHFVDFVYPEAKSLLRSTVRSVGDLNGDGRVEIAVNIFNVEGDRRWHLYVIDALRGWAEPVADVLDAYLWDVRDVNRDGRAEIFVSREVQAAPAEWSTLSLLSFGAGTWAESWRTDSARWVVKGFDAIASHVSTISRNLREGIVDGDPTGAGPRLFFARSRDETSGYDLGEAGVEKKWTHADGELLAVDENLWGQPGFLAQRASGILLAQNSAGELVFGRAGGREGVPAVVDLDGDGRAELLLSAYGRVRAFHLAENGEAEELWSVPGRGTLPAALGRSNPAARRVAPLSFASSADLDGDGQLEVPVADSQERFSRLRLLGADGAEKWSHTFSEFPALGYEAGLYAWSLGRYADSPKEHIFLSAYRGGWNSEASRLLDGATGEVLWGRDDFDERGFGPFGGYAATEASADQKSDRLVLLAKDRLYRASFMPEHLERLPDQPGLYHTTTLVDVDHDGHNEILLHGGYQGVRLLRPDGSEVWSRDTLPWELYGRHGALTDLDGDGVPELAVARLEGTFEVWDLTRGTTLWQTPLGSTANDLAAVSIDGGVTSSFVAATKGGALVALGGGARTAERWRLQFAVSLGDPIPADAWGTGRSQILVVGSDGYLYVVDEQKN